MARSTFVSQNAQNTSVWEPFWKFRCSKIVRRCGAKHICESKCTKHRMLGPILDVPMSKNCTPLWRKAHLSVTIDKITPQSRSNVGNFDPEKLHAAVERSAFVSQNAQNPTIAEQFWKFRSGKIAPRCGAKHICNSKCAKRHTLGPLFQVPLSKNGTPLWREAHLQVQNAQNTGLLQHFERFLPD